LNLKANVQLSIPQTDASRIKTRSNGPRAKPESRALTFLRLRKLIDFPLQKPTRKIKMPEFSIKNDTKAKKGMRNVTNSALNSCPCPLRFRISHSFWWLTAEGFFAKCECYIFPKSRSSEVSASSRKALPQRELKNDELRRAINPKLRFQPFILSGGLRLTASPLRTSATKIQNHVPDSKTT
jgi:hypothetical protein